MASNRRKKQNRAKASAQQAEARRRRTAAARIHAVQARLGRIYDPETPVAELAVLLAEHYQGVPVAGWLVSALRREGSSLERLQGTARLMLAVQDASSLTVLTFAAAVAGAAGDAEEERRLIDQALAADEAGDPDVGLEIIDFISASGHAADAVELLELKLNEVPVDDFAVELYGTAIERAYATANADESAGRERAAVHRFADRTGLIALRDAVSAFLDGTELGEAVRARVTEELSVTDDLDWLPEDRVAIPRAPRCGRSRPTRRHRRRWRPGPWPGLARAHPLWPVADRRAGPGTGAVVHRYRLWHRAVRRVPVGGDGRPAAVDGVAGRHGPGRRDLAQHGGGSQAQSGRGRCGRGVHK